MKTNIRAHLALLAIAGGLAACATSPTPALVDARQAYDEARTGVANDYAPDKVREAKVALEKAEREHEVDPGSYDEAHLAYLAHRRALMARAAAQEKISRMDIIAARERADEVLLAQRERARDRLRENTELMSEQKKSLEAERAARMRAEQMLSEFAKVKAEEQKMTITLSGSVLFKYNEATLLPIARDRLDRVAEVLKDYGEGKRMTVVGHTDSRGSASFNENLSRKRAEAVRDYLIGRGVDSNQLMAEGRGENEPVAANDSADGRANNRRVEIVIDGSNSFTSKPKDSGSSMPQGSSPSTMPKSTPPTPPSTTPEGSTMPEKKHDH